MTRKRRTERQWLGAIDPAGSYRTTLSEEIFGLGPQRIIDKEKSGELPPSSPLTPSSRFRAWTGQQILDHRAKMQALVSPPRPQPKQFAAAQKIKKQKLRPPAKHQRESA
jgi:hypothetical protein